MRVTPTYISFYTKDTPYQQEVKYLEATLKQYHLPYKIYEKENRRSWNKNTQIKAEVILEALNEFTTPIVWVDSDAKFFGEPKFFNNLNCDISVYYLHTSYNPNELLSGTLYFGNTDKAKSLVKEWIELNNKNETPDQRNLQEVFERRKDKLVVTPLPIDYIKIDKFDKFQPGGDKACIRHFQASRRYRKLIK